MSVSREWLDDHGYAHIRCSRCGWSGWTDTGVCEGCSPSGETCEDCGESRQGCSCTEGFAHAGTCRTHKHVARRDHRGGGIKKGDTYKVTRTHYWREGGPSWWQARKTVVSRAAAC